MSYTKEIKTKIFYMTNIMNSERVMSDCTFADDLDFSVTTKQHITSINRIIGWE